MLMKTLNDLVASEGKGLPANLDAPEASAVADSVGIRLPARGVKVADKLMDPPRNVLTEPPRHMPSQASDR